MFYSNLKIKRVAGFSLLELLAVLVIIVVLGAIAVPTYLTYVERARFQNVIAAADKYKLQLALCYQSTGKLSDCGNGGLASESAVTYIPAASGSEAENVADVTVSPAGLITATSKPSFGNGSTAYDYKLQAVVPTNPSLGSTGISWVATGGSCIAQKLC